MRTQRRYFRDEAIRDLIRTLDLADRIQFMVAMAKAVGRSREVYIGKDSQKRYRKKPWRPPLSNALETSVRIRRKNLKTE